jgi:hypothetical protein
VATLPGLALGNRISGAGLALAWGAFLATLVLSVVSLFRLPAAVAGQLDDSSVAATLTDPHGVPQTVFAQVSGDRVLGVLLSLDDLIGGRRAIIEGTERVEFEPADVGSLTSDPAADLLLYEGVNAERDRAGVAMLAWSDSLASVARAHAEEMYLAGYFSHLSPVSGTVGDRLDGARAGFGRYGENLALAADAAEAHDGLVDSTSHFENMIDPAYAAVGIAAVDGPLGLMVVQVYGG